MKIALVAINPNPRAPIGDINRLLDEALGQTGFAGRALRSLADYPPAKPWKGRTPSRGPRKGGRRTGNLGRNWRLLTPATNRGTRVWGTTNRTRYGIYVQGPQPGVIRQRQTPNMRDRGWPNITRVGRQTWTFYGYRVRRILMQDDPRIRHPRMGR